jgi:hypothetical protein
LHTAKHFFFGQPDGSEVPEVALFPSDVALLPSDVASVKSASCLGSDEALTMASDCAGAEPAVTVVGPDEAEPPNVPVVVELLPVGPDEADALVFALVDPSFALRNRPAGGAGAFCLAARRRGLRNIERERSETHRRRQQAPL